MEPSHRLRLLRMLVAAFRAGPGCSCLWQRRRPGPGTRFANGHPERDATGRLSAKRKLRRLRAENGPEQDGERWFDRDLRWTPHEGCEPFVLDFVATDGSPATGDRGIQGRSPYGATASSGFLNPFILSAWKAVATRTT
jgi:hypothetical protein